MAVFDNQTGKLTPQSLLHQRYIVIDLVGRGGMGAVYRAIDTRSTNPPNRHVAVKEMSQNHLNATELTEATRRFQREAEMLGSLSHPNLPHIYEAFSEGGRYYLVMDFIAGKTLLQLLKESGGRSLPVMSMLNYAIQLCSVLDYLHQQQPPIIFRDLKPANVMVTEHGHVLLIDFGIARIFKEGQLQDTLFLGSPGYASPEQHGLAQTSPRSDLYSLGATIHCCLTGRDPYHATDRFTFLPMRQFNPQVPIELDQLVQRLVTLNEQQRPASANEVRQALIRIAQQSTENTTALQSSSSMDPSAPTQYSLPPAPTMQNAAVPSQAPTAAVSSTPARAQAAPDAPASPLPPQAPTVAIASPAPRPVSGQTPPGMPPLDPAQTLLGTEPPPGRRARGSAPVWTKGFIALFALLLVVMLAASLFAINAFLVPADSPIEYGLAFLVEGGVALLLLFSAIVASTRVRTFIPRVLLFFTGLAALAAALGLLTLALTGVQASLAGLLSLSSAFSLSQPLHLLATAGLVAAAIISLAWLVRPFALRERLVLFVLFGAAAVCALLQYFSGFQDQQMSRHIVLLLALVALVEGVLLATQAERAVS